MNFDNIYVILDKSKMIVHNIFLDEVFEFKNINDFLNSVERKNIYITNTKKFPLKLGALIFNLYSFTENDTKMVHQSLNSLYIRQKDNISLSSAVFPYKTTMEIKSEQDICKMVNNSRFLKLKKEFLDNNNYYNNGQDFNNLKKYYHQKINNINITFDKEINYLKERLKLLSINFNDNYKKVLSKIENKTQSKLLTIQETKLSFLKKLKLIYHQNNYSLTSTVNAKPVSKPVIKPVSKQVRNTKLFEEYNDRISNIKFLKNIQKNVFVLYTDKNQIESFTKKSNQHLKYQFIKKTSLSDPSVARYNRIRQNFVNESNLSCFDLIKIFEQVKSEFFMILDISINQDKNFFSKLSQIKIEKKNSCVILANPSNSTLSLENIGLIFKTIYVKGTLLPFIKKRLPKVSDLITKLPNTVMYADFLCKEPSKFDGTITGDKLNHRILKDIQESCMVINLKKDYQKKEILLTNNQHTNINFCFIDGVDGSIEDLGEINPKVMNRNTIRNKNQLAYLYSTYLALRAGVTLDSRYFMVLDDDVIFHKNFVEEFLKLDIPEDFNVIRLGISPNHNEKFNTNIVKSKNFNNGSFATIYKTSYVKNNLLDRVKTLNILYDHLFPFLENSYDLTEPLVIAELYSSSIMNIRNMKEFADKFNWNLDNFNFLDSQRLASVVVKGDDENKVNQIIKCLESQHYQNHQIYIENDNIRNKKIGTNLKLVNEIGEFKVDISNIENSNWLSNKMKEYICSKNKLGKNNLTVTIFSSLFNCDKYIDNYIFCLENLKDFDLHKMIIWNIIDSNNNLTNEKIRKFCINKTNVTLLEKTKSQDNGLYDSWNSMLDMIDTELVCNYNADDKLHPNYIIDYVKEFNTDSKLNLVFSPLTVSRDLNDSFHMNLPLMFNTKMIFFNNEENVGDNEPEYMNLEYKIKILNDYEDGKINVSKKNVMYENLTIFDFFKNKGNILKMEDWIPRNLVGCAPMWRKSLYDKYGGFNEEEFKGAADFDLWLRFFSKEGNFKKLDKSYVMYYYNINSYFHNKNHDDVHKKLVENYLNIDFNKILCIEPMFGLGNRLRAIASAYSIAKANNYLLKILWVPDCHCDIEFNELFKNNFMLLKSIDLSNFKKYNYYEVENPNGKGEYIDTNYKKIYVKSNCVLSNKHSFEYFNEFFNILIPSDDVASKLIDTSNMIGVHCRMGGGANQENVKADKLDNWTNQEQLDMIKYRNLSHVDYFINIINEELLKNFNQKIYVACDLPSSYEKLERIYGDKIVKLNRNSYNRDKTEIIEGLADMINLSKCYKFYGSFWSSFSENVTYFSQHKNNKMSNNFYRTTIGDKNYFGMERNKTKNTIVTACMNRNDNLKQAIVSWLNVKNLDEIVIIDWGSKNKVVDTLKEFNDSRIKVYRVDNADKWVLSHAFNIGLLCSSNENIYKLDCDDIVRSDLIIEHPLDENSFYAGNWKDAKTQNELQINGKLFCQFKNFNKVNFYNEIIIYYGWDDDDIYLRLDTIISRKKINIELFEFIEHDDNNRLSNGFQIDIKKNQLIQRNRALCQELNVLTWSNNYNMCRFEYKNSLFYVIKKYYIPTQIYS